MKKLLMIVLAAFAFAGCGKDDEKQGVDPVTYNVTVSSNNTSHGTVTPTDVQTDETGTTFAITATPEDGYKFVNWTCTGEGTQVASAASESTTATIGTSDGTITANFAEIEPNLATPTAPYILYWDGERMQVGAWGVVTQSNIMFTKFGSAVAFTVTSNEDTWDAGDVKFDPMGASYEDYEDIPCWNGDSNEDGYISSVNYHTLANVRAGCGDICKLAGLTKADIDAGVFDNESFRLPTDAENMADYGSGTEFVGSRGEPGPGVRIGSDDSTFLPAVGLRTTSGTTLVVYSNGYYWSSRPSSAPNGYHLLFHTIVLPSYNNTARSGFAVRCVPQ